jgi:galactokinase
LKQRLPGIRSLRDVSVADFKKHESDLPEPIRRRCRHVVTENERTLEAAAALASGDREELASLMRRSHESLRDDYEVSCRELDVMVDIAARHRAVFGARMTGGGFGGCTINIVRSDAVDEFRESIETEYRAATNIKPDVYVVEADEGARENAS